MEDQRGGRWGRGGGVGGDSSYLVEGVRFCLERAL